MIKYHCTRIIKPKEISQLGEEEEEEEENVFSSFCCPDNGGKNVSG
jgi:hypothetical protein